MSETSNPSEALQNNEVSFSELSTDEFITTWGGKIHELTDGDFPETPVTAYTIESGGLKTDCLEVHSHYQGGSISNKSVWLMDSSQDGEFVGYGIVIANRDGSPFVGDVVTEKAFRKMGYGERRIKLMNEVAKKEFGKTINSGPRGMIEPEAVRIFERLEQEDLVESYDTKTGRRWRFLH